MGLVKAHPFSLSINGYIRDKTFCIHLFGNPRCTL